MRGRIWSRYPCRTTGCRVVAAIWLLLVLSGCKGGNPEQLPVDFVWDQVACETCRMALSDRRYSAQVIDHRGRPYYFDDIGCAILWLEKQPWKERARTWVNDAQSGEWIDAREANWIYGDPKTPMGYGFAATRSPVDDRLAWEEVRQRMIMGKHLVNRYMIEHLKGGTGR